MKLFILCFFFQETTIYHYFKEPADPRNYIQKIEKISKSFDLFNYGWKKFQWHFYFDFLVKNGKFSYCIKFFDRQRINR